MAEKRLLLKTDSSKKCCSSSSSFSFWSLSPTISQSFVAAAMRLAVLMSFSTSDGVEKSKDFALISFKMFPMLSLE